MARGRRKNASKPARTDTSAPAPAVAQSRAVTRPSPATHSVAVTGACSFLGKNLIGLLEEDERVGRIVSLDIERPTTAGQKTRVYDVDLTQPTAEERTAEILAAERVDVVVHLAFLASPTHATAWAHELESVGTMHVLNACRRSEVQKLVMWSQTVLYGAHPTNPNFLSERHPLRARREDPFFADKIEAENEALRFGKPGKGRVVTVLRTAPILGPTVKNYVTQYLSRRLVPTVLGFDPLMQFVHEADAVAAFKLAVDHDVPGVFNIVADGVLPLSTVVKLAGRMALPLPRPLATPLVNALWLAHLSEAPPALLDYLQYLCVADGAQAERAMGFSPVYTTREAVIDYASAQHLRDVRLLSETPA
ncbi:MAG: NAD-dependent epimerase/dehydratase family protein [Polyangiaceae bacterium]|nr:NAD-dependent epimerase/dehydratase family protein [Polyangiaceae bacterium]MBK8998139.1 NAD-dependent epimerase/dehydratase family protein [Myxococcales bacterium]MCL4748998.1 NAD-dependent epimerase/dehydratase family protein [Myxococcales bacterium]